MNSTETDITGTHTILVHSIEELSAGDWVSATYKGVLVHRGQVTDIAPNHELFWIMDALTGSRRLLDLAEFGITRTKAPERLTSDTHAA